MPRRLIDLGGGKPLLDIASYARRGSGRRDRLSREEIELIDRTVRRAPEVMVKVLSRGGQDLKAVGRHIEYLNRGGDVEIETDDGQRLAGKGAEKELLEDWDLDLEVHRRTSDLESRPRRILPKLVHKLMFSMPPGTPPDKVLAAVKDFAREEFGAKHRYGMVLHTDEPHPHVHLVVKAMSEEGVRLNIRKATLRAWRQEFARHLRAHGLSANATERAVRGEIESRWTDQIYRAAQRGESLYVQNRIESLARGEVNPASGKDLLLETRSVVVRGWGTVAQRLATGAQTELASLIRQFVARMPPPRTENERLLATKRARSEELSR